MTLYQIAFKDSVATGVVGQFASCGLVSIRSMFLSEYGLTILADVTDEDILEVWDWAFCMLCNMEQEVE